MAKKTSGAVVPLAVIGLCAAIFAVVVVAASGNTSQGDSAPGGFLLTLVVLAVVGSLVAVVWRALSRRRQGH